MKRIYVDVDDVISKTTETYIKVAREAFGSRAAFEDLKTFDLRASFNLTENQYGYFFDLVHQPAFLESFEAVDGAAETLCRWKRSGHRVDIVTGRPTSAREVTLDWLASRGIPFDNFIMVDKYNRPGNDPAIAITKADLARSAYDLAVEDSAEMALFLACEMGVRTALISRPWNLTCPASGNLVRCRDWEGVGQLA